MFPDVDSTGPTAVDLAGIDHEWPLIAAELDQLDAEIRLIYAEDRGGPTDLDWQRVRSARRRVLRAAAAHGYPVATPQMRGAA